MRIVETDYEWCIFYHELKDAQFARIKEIGDFLSSFEINGKVDMSQFSDEKINKLKQLKLERYKIPSFLEGLPEKDWDIETVFDRIKEDFSNKGIILKNENKNNRKFSIVYTQAVRREFQVTKATVTKMMLDSEYGENYRKDIFVLQTFFENLAQKDDVLALEILKMIEKRTAYIIIKGVLKSEKNKVVEQISFVMKTIKNVFVKILSELQIEPSQLKEIINSIGEPAKLFTSKVWFKNVYFSNPNLAKLLQEIYDFLYHYHELDDVKTSLSK